jgi:hypothetical protein
MGRLQASSKTRTRARIRYFFMEFLLRESHGVISIIAHFIKKETVSTGYLVKIDANQAYNPACEIDGEEAADVQPSI